MRLDEILKENKDFKGTSSLMERKVDELTEENGVLSSQVKTHVQSFSLSLMRRLATNNGHVQFLSFNMSRLLLKLEFLLFTHYSYITESHVSVLKSQIPLNTAF